MSKVSLICFGMEGGSWVRSRQARWSWVGSLKEKDFSQWRSFLNYEKWEGCKGQESWEASALNSPTRFSKEENNFYRPSSSLLLETDMPSDYKMNFCSPAQTWKSNSVCIPTPWGWIDLPCRLQLVNSSCPALRFDYQGRACSKGAGYRAVLRTMSTTLALVASLDNLAIFSSSFLGMSLFAISLWVWRKKNNSTRFTQLLVCLYEKNLILLHFSGHLTLKISSLERMVVSLKCWGQASWVNQVTLRILREFSISVMLGVNPYVSILYILYLIGTYICWLNQVCGGTGRLNANRWCGRNSLQVILWKELCLCHFGGTDQRVRKPGRKLRE